MSVATVSPKSPTPFMRIQFLNHLDLYKQGIDLERQHNLQRVGTGREIVTDKYVWSGGMSPCLGILLSDGQKTYFRHHCPGGAEDKPLIQRLTAGLRQLDRQKPIQGLVIGGQDTPKTSSLIDRITRFFKENQVRFSQLAPQRDRSNTYATDLLFNPHEQEVRLSNRNSLFPSNEPGPLLRNRATVDRFYRTAHLAESTLELAEPDAGEFGDAFTGRPDIQESPDLEIEQADSEPGCRCC